MLLINILLLAVLFVAALLSLFYNIPLSKKLSSLFQYFLPTKQNSPSDHVNDSNINNNREKEEKKKNVHDDRANRHKTIRKMFDTFDKNRDGFITKQELMESMRNIRIVMSEKEVEEMVMKVDDNGDGLIDFEEFSMFCSSNSSSIGGSEECLVGEKIAEEEEELVILKDAFDVFDKDKDGLISEDELGLVLSSLGLKEGKRIEGCKEMIRQVDVDGDGMVNFDEFKNMMKQSGSS